MITTTTRSLSKISKELSNARKQLRIMSHARIRGLDNGKVSNELLVYLIEKITRLEIEDANARNRNCSL